MKAKHLLISLTLGLGLVLALLWMLDEWPVPAIAAPAAEIHVCKEGPPTCDYASIQDAVDAAASGGVIKVATGVYTDINDYGGGHQVLHVDRTLTVRGGYTTTNWDTSFPITQPTTLDAQGQGHVLYIVAYADSISVTIESMNITGGQAESGGGIDIRPNVTATISNNHIFSNTAGSGGGASLFRSTARFVGNTFISNTATGSGGGLTMGSSEVTFVENTFFSNTGRRGGGLHMAESTATLTSNHFLSNTATEGGGLLLSRSSALVLSNLMD
jgi:hypothetical protein